MMNCMWYLLWMWVINPVLSNCKSDFYFPDEYHRLNKGTSLLIESRPAVTCGTKQTHPWSCEQAIPTSWLFVRCSHPQQTTPMWSHCYIHPHRTTKMHKLVNLKCYLTSESCEILDIMPNLESCEYASPSWVRTITASFTSAEPTTVIRWHLFSGLSGNVIFQTQHREASMYPCYHTVHITPLLYAFRFITACKGYAYLL